MCIDTETGLRNRLAELSADVAFMRAALTLPCQTRYMGNRPKGKRGLYCQRTGVVVVTKHGEWRVVCRQHAKSWVRCGWEAKG